MLADPKSLEAMQAVGRRAAKAPRDVRLDAFRGLCLIIIFVAHVFDNPWAAWIPARFGFSDATEIFVFCSGMASALAFGRVFTQRGMTAGTLRVAHRCWEVYWAHIGLFLVAMLSMVLADRWLDNGHGYIDGLGLSPLVGNNALAALAGLMTLSWVPPFFDILPMYLVILTMIPIVMFLAGRDKRYVIAFVGGAWLLAYLGLLTLPADPWSARGWFFNPFAWQLIFFTGFSLTMGWLPAPAPSKRLVLASVGIVVLSVPLAWMPLVEAHSGLATLREQIMPLIDKSRFGLLRFAHFLALAYLAYLFAGEGGRRIAGPIAEFLGTLGQQSLAVFMSGIVLSMIAGVVLNLTGRGFWSVAVVNASGIALLLAVAVTVRFFKSAPWKNKLPDAAHGSRSARPHGVETGDARRKAA